ncbi:MAG: tetratricopeptide repeat protein [Acidobacteriota bacterium]
MQFIKRIGNLDARLFLLPLLLTLSCFANTLGHDFVYDDRFQIVEAAPIRDWRSENLVHLFDRDVWAFFSQDLSWEGKIRSQYYRPLFALFVMINYLYAGLSAWGWHLTAVLLHCLATLLVYQLLLVSLSSTVGSVIEIREIRLLTVVATLYFAIHPAQSESVAWVSAYVNALSAIFILGALLAYLHARINAQWRWLGLGATLYALALLTKEMAIIVPVIIAAYELFILANPGNWRARGRTLLLMCGPFLVVTAGYLALRIAIFGQVKLATASLDFPTLTGMGIMVNLYTLPSVVLKYLEIICWPFALRPMYGVRYVLAAGLGNFYLPLVLLIILSVLALIFARKSVLVRLGLIWLIVPLLPVLDIRSFRVEDLVHDRYLYLSLIGAGILLVSIGGWVSQRLSNGVTRLRPSIALLTTALLLLMLATTVKQNSVWADEWQLWSAAQESVPDSCTVNLELGRLNEEAENDLVALEHYQRALRICPDSVMLQYKLGLLWGRHGELSRAQEAFQHMSELSLNRIIRATAHFNLGVVYERQGHWEQAVKHYQEGIRLNPNSKNTAQVRQAIDELMAKIAQGAAK